MSHDQGGNPFSTARVRPGAIAYRFSQGEDLSAVVQSLAEHDWRGQIVGPHGSGKSTLLAALLPAVEASGKRVTLVELHDGQRRLPVDIDAVPGNTVLVVDGYEQLPWWRRCTLYRRCRRREIGLLVTTHRSAGLPTIFRTNVTADVAGAIVKELLDGWPEVISREQIVLCVARHGQDLREALFELYDLFEQRRRPGA